MLKYATLMMTGLALSLPVFAEDAPETAPETATEAATANPMDQVSYAMGMDLGSMLDQQDLGISADKFYEGMKDAMAGSPKMSPEEAREVLQAFETEIREKSMAKMEEAAENNIEEAAAFLAANAKKEGITVTESGLQYEVIQEGEGDSPSAGSTVTVHYTGKLLDDSVFDSSVERGEPATFPLNRVIPGWTEGLQLMSPGAKYRFYIPADLAYGERGAPPRIGPNAALIFDVELLEIQ